MLYIIVALVAFYVGFIYGRITSNGKGGNDGW